MKPASSIITPLSSEQQQRVIDETNSCILRANKLFNIKAKPIDIKFNLKGRATGMYRIKQKRKFLLTHCEKEIPRLHSFISTNNGDKYHQECVASLKLKYRGCIYR